MKLKTGLFALAAMLMAFALTGCYTQLAKTERTDTPPEYTEATEEQYQEEDSYGDARHVTNVYIYDDFYARRYYWDRWDPWDPWYSWRYRYPRSGWYVSFGYYDYDYWNWWCGTPWDRYYNPWWDHYYAWGPRWGWNYPYYDHYGNYPRSRGYVNEKRPFGRRSTERGDEGGAVSRRGTDRGSLSKPDENVYARGEDGVYRRTRRTVADSPTDTRTDAVSRTSDGRRSARRGTSADTDSRSSEVVRMPNSGSTSVARPAGSRETPTDTRQPASTSERRTSKRESSDNNKVSRRSHDDNRSSSSRGSSSSSTSTSRRSSNSGSSSSGVSRSGGSSSGSSSKGSSNNNSSSSSSSSSGSNRRTKN